MRAITASELSRMRSSEQFTTLHLLVVNPETVLSAQATAAPANYDSVSYLNWNISSGNISDVIPGMTLWIGSSPGGFDVGVVRVRSGSTTSYVNISETSDIDWTGNEYLTVKKEFAIWRKDVRILTGFDDQQIVYMDWNVIYQNQHSVTNPVVNMGIDAVIDITDGEVDVHFNADSSFTIEGEIISYTWEAATASSSSGMDTATPTIGFDTAGSHLVSCTVVTSLGASKTGYRFVHASPETIDFEVMNILGSFDSGEWRAEFSIRESISIPDRARVIIYAKDYYQGELDPVGYVYNRENIVFIGWIVAKSTHVDPETNFTTYTAAGPATWLRKIKAFIAGVEDTDYADNGGGTPNRWTEFQNMTPMKVLWHFLEWRSTATNCIDIMLPIDDDRQIAQVYAPEATLWEQMIYASNRVNLCFPLCDKFSRLFVIQDIQYVSIASRVIIPVVMDLEDGDYSEMQIDKRVVPGLYYAEVSGVWFYNGDAGPLGAKAPGSVPRNMGDGETVFAELAMRTQAEAIELAGLVLGSKADDPANVSISMQMINRMFDIAPHGYIRLTFSGDTDQSFEYTNKKLAIRAIQFVYDNTTGFHSTELECEAEGIQLPAIAMIFPNDGGDPILPPIEPPYLPPLPPNLPPGPVEPGDSDAVVSTTSDARTTGNLESTPSWTSELTSAFSIIDSSLVPGSADVMFLLEDQSVWKTSNLSDGGAASWVEVYTATQFAAGGEVSDPHFLRIIAANSEVIYILAYGEQNGNDYPYVLRSANGGVSWTPHIADATPLEPLPYTVTEKTFPLYHPNNGNYWLIQRFPYGRTGDDQALNYNPVAIAHYRNWPTNILQFRFTWDAYNDTINMYGDDREAFELNYTLNAAMPTAMKNLVNAFCQEYFGSRYETLKGGTHTGGMPFNSQYTMTHLETWMPGSGNFTEYVVWNVPSAGIPKAFAVAPSNSNILYIGLEDKIIASNDGGGYWWTMWDAHGANDVYVDPQLSGALYYWSTDGKLNLMTSAGVDQEGIMGIEGMMTENPLVMPLRIAKDVNSGRLLAMPNGTVLKMRYLGANTDLATGLSAGTGLHVYSGDKAIFVDGSNIYTIDDLKALTPTVNTKTGDWTTYVNGVNAHRIT